MFFNIGSHFGPFSLCFSIGSYYEGGKRELGCREMKKKKKEIEKIGLKVNVYLYIYIYILLIFLFLKYILLFLFCLSSSYRLKSSVSVNPFRLNPTLKP